MASMCFSECFSRSYSSQPDGPPAGAEGDAEESGAVLRVLQSSSHLPPFIRMRRLNGVRRGGPTSHRGTNDFSLH
ncbi:hypothetical protein EYF80_026037 [Liparis tanakae]|uniref:Uncharacterized protein n=1 Tax=Liparis tanakae TaxID=230148 RepID=A0A4Z2HDV5_9TELE|nr:hypothetical protein EYF80_026037 [Liparis tanakae]